MEIRERRPADLDQVISLYFNAYPLEAGSRDELASQIAARPTLSNLTPYVAVDEGDVVGAYILHAYEAQFGGNLIPTAGLAGVAVSMDARRRGVARRLVEHFLEQARARGMPLSMLYPFRFDFYEQLGWGAALEVREHCFSPGSLPDSPLRRQVRRVRPGDDEGIMACYEHLLFERPAMIRRSEEDWADWFQHTDRVFCFVSEEGIEGYLRFRFKKDGRFGSDTHHILILEELVYTTSDALSGLLAFLRSQSDQITSIEAYLPSDERLELRLRDPVLPRYETLPKPFQYSLFTRRVGMGLMLRVLDPRAALLARSGWNGVELRVRLEVTDPLLPAAAAPFTLLLKDGRARLDDRPAALLRVDAPAFAQLYAGFASATELQLAGRLHCEDETILPELDRAFKPGRAPFCLHSF
jgi:predicted acetyltransferase